LSLRKSSPEKGEQVYLDDREERSSRLGHALSLDLLCSESIVLAGSTVAIEPGVSADVSLGTALSYWERLAAACADFRTSVRQVRCHHSPPVLSKSQKTAAMLEQQSAGVRSTSFDRRLPRRKVANSCHVIVSSDLEESPEPSDSHAQLSETIGKEPVAVSP
jgi:hypothetical protein